MNTYLYKDFILQSEGERPEPNNYKLAGNFHELDYKEDLQIWLYSATRYEVEPKEMINFDEVINSLHFENNASIDKGIKIDCEIEVYYPENEFTTEKDTSGNPYLKRIAYARIKQTQETQERSTSTESEAYWRDRIEGEAVKFLIWVRENQFRVTTHPKLKGKWFSDKIDAGYKTNSELFDMFRDQSK